VAVAQAPARLTRGARRADCADGGSRRFVMRRVLATQVAAAVAAALVVPAAAQGSAGGATSLQPHRAVYNLNLVRTGASADVVSTKGRLAYEIEGSSCTGYKVNSRFVTRIVDREGTARTSDMRSSSVETVTPPTFSFRNEEYLNETRTSAVEGTAEASADGIVVHLEEPKASEITLPSALFPSAHTLLSIEAARNGDSVIEAPIYDGGESADKVYQTTIVIGPAETGLPNATADELAALSRIADADTATTRHYVISYFDTGGAGEPTPRYVLTFEMLDSGISYAATFDYGDFVLSGTLSELELGEAPACEQAPAAGGAN
jgi:hypothetical protein